NPIPYWHYLLSPNDCDGDCTFYSQAPSLTGSDPTSIESQLNLYVETYLESCLLDFEAFIGYEITPQERPKVQTMFRENDVQMKLTYPLEISTLDKKSQISEWSKTFDVPLRRMYELATALAAAQIEYHYLEWHMLEIIT